MGINIINIFLSIIMLIIIPTMTGLSVLELTGNNVNITKSFLIGHITIWAFCQLITVPLVCMKKSFIMVVAFMTVFMIVMSILGLTYLKKLILKNKEKKLKYQKKEYLLLVLTFALMMLMVLLNVITQHIDYDDARFVVNAVDIERTNKMFLINPATGQYVGGFFGEIVKDVSSPWAVYIAFVSRMTCVHPTIMAHSILSAILMLIICATVWEMAEIFWNEDIASKSIFSCLVMFLYLYGNYSLYSSERFIIVRLWQGKAVVAGFGIPLIFIISMWIYKDEKKIGNYILLFITGTGICLLSGMGIIIGAIMIGSIGLVYGIAKKNIKSMLLIWICVLPEVAYYAINQMLGKGMIG